MFFVVFSLACIDECRAYWMRYSYVDISHQYLLNLSTCLFMLPIFLLLLQRKFHCNPTKLLFIRHIVISFITIFLLVITFDNPCQYDNNISYKTTNVLMVIVYYLFVLFSLITGISLVITTPVATTSSHTRSRTGSFRCSTQSQSLIGIRARRL